MTIFDQRNQRVNYQYNAAGDINFGAGLSLGFRANPSVRHITSTSWPRRSWS